MSTIEIILITVIISSCIAIYVGAVVMHEIYKKHKEDLGMLNARIDELEKRWTWLDERYAKHEAKYHR